MTILQWSINDLPAFIEKIKDNNNYDENTSWDICFEAFSTPKKNEYHSLHLGFYLASWGMYRGSSQLGKKNYLIHEAAVDIVFKGKYKPLKCSPSNEVDKSHIDLIIELKDELANHYAEHQISPTDTLISKIILGTLGCVLAYDRYVVAGLMPRTRTFNKNSLVAIFDFISNNKKTIQYVQNEIKEKTGKYYTFMKIVDMYFWKKGFDEEERKFAQ